MTRVTIPADHWHANNDGTAWLIAQRCRDDRAPQEAHWGVGHPCVYGCRALDRPCGTCDGRGIAAVTSRGEDGYDVCPDCIDGRHTFTVEVACDFCNGNTPPPNVVAPPCWKCAGRKSGAHRVSIAPGMVLPVQADPSPGSAKIGFDGVSFWHYNTTTEPWTHERVTLPPAARPGMWAVKLAVQS